MIHDAQLLFSDAQAITATAVSTNVVDLSQVRDIGTGESLYIVVTIDVAFTDTGSDSTIDVTLQGGATAGATTASQVLFRLPALATAGSVYIARLDPNGMTNLQAQNPNSPLAFRFIQITYTVNNGNLTTGTVTKFLTNAVQQVPHYAIGYTVA